METIHFAILEKSGFIFESQYNALFDTNILKDGKEDLWHRDEPQLI